MKSIGTGSAPGRVNLIGDHTDYNGGLVLPAPIRQQTHVFLSCRTDTRFTLASDQAADLTVLESLPERKTGGWSDYVCGVLHVLQKEFPLRHGLDIQVKSDVPMGSGLSSSAALEVATCRAYCDLMSIELKPERIARIGQEAENTFVGVQCGLMDQMCSSAGKPGHALFFDTQESIIHNLPIPEAFSFAVVHSGVSRSLADGRYNIRQKECQDACTYLRVRSLRDILEGSGAAILQLPDPLNRRVRHVVSECARVIDAAEALVGQDIRRFGELMLESHYSLQHDYEVSIAELDSLVQMAVDEGALGARLTGAGFGGAIVALIPEQQKQDWSQQMFARGVHPSQLFFI